MDTPGANIERHDLPRDRRGTEGQPVGARAVQRVSNVEVMGERFRPIFEWMHRCVSADKSTLPIWRRPVLIVTRLRIGIVELFVSKYASELIDKRGSALHGQIIVVMGDLVSKVPEQGSIGFSQFYPRPLTKRIVRLGNV